MVKMVVRKTPAYIISITSPGMSLPISVLVVTHSLKSRCTRSVSTVEGGLLLAVSASMSVSSAVESEEDGSSLLLLTICCKNNK